MKYDKQDVTPDELFKAFVSISLQDNLQKTAADASYQRQKKIFGKKRIETKIYRTLFSLKKSYEFLMRKEEKNLEKNFRINFQGKKVSHKKCLESFPCFQVLDIDSKKTGGGGLSSSPVLRSLFLSLHLQCV